MSNGSPSDNLNLEKKVTNYFSHEDAENFNHKIFLGYKNRKQFYKRVEVYLAGDVLLCVLYFESYPDSIHHHNISIASSGPNQMSAC